MAGALKAIGCGDRRSGYRLDKILDLNRVPPTVERFGLWEIPKCFNFLKQLAKPLQISRKEWACPNWRKSIAK